MIDLTQTIRNLARVVSTKTTKHPLLHSILTRAFLALPAPVRGEQMVDATHAIFEGYANGTLEIYIMTTRWHAANNTGAPAAVRVEPTVIERAKVRLAKETADANSAATGG